MRIKRIEGHIPVSVSKNTQEGWTITPEDDTAMIDAINEFRKVKSYLLAQMFYLRKELGLSNEMNDRDIPVIERQLNSDRYNNNALGIAEMSYYIKKLGLSQRILVDDQRLEMDDKIIKRRLGDYRTEREGLNWWMSCLSKKAESHTV